MGKGFKHGGGGGSELNFRVIGAAEQPVSARENDIWVACEGMTGWVFAADRPEEAAEGLVWLTVGTESSVAFNALKKNALEVYPLSAAQYISGAWSTVDAFIWQESAWTKFSEIITDLILYDNGTSNAEFILTNADLESTYISLSAPKSGSASVRTTETYTLDKYTRCEVDFSDFSSGGASASPTLYLTVRDEGGNNVASANILKSDAKQGTLSLSIDLTGQHTITVSVTNASSNYVASVKVTGIRLLM